jgi:hypothetical protein
MNMREVLSCVWPRNVSAKRLSVFRLTNQLVLDRFRQLGSAGYAPALIRAIRALQERPNVSVILVQSSDEVELRGRPSGRLGLSQIGP